MVPADWFQKQIYVCKLISVNWCQKNGISRLVSADSCQKNGISRQASTDWRQQTGVSKMMSADWFQKQIYVSKLKSVNWCQKAGVKRPCQKPGISKLACADWCQYTCYQIFIRVRLKKNNLFFFLVHVCFLLKKNFNQNKTNKKIKKYT